MPRELRRAWLPIQRWDVELLYVRGVVGAAWMPGSEMNRVIGFWPDQEKEWMDCELPCGICICVGTLTGKKPHYVLVSWR